MAEGNPGLIRAMAAELRLLRRLPGQFTDVKLARAPFICKGLGGGDVGAAMNRLLLVHARHKNDAEITAAFASIGLGADGDTVLDRLTDYGEANFVDGRTVRRWSDAGIAKLAPLLVGEAPWVDPRIGLRLSVEADDLVCAIEFVVPEQIGMNRPQLLVNGEPHDLIYQRASADTTAYATRYRCKSVRVGLSKAERIELVLRWTGEIMASYVFETKDMGVWRTSCRLRFEQMMVVVVTKSPHSVRPFP
ncbi:hypothetical protein [Micromonospora sp. NPDC048898]|uniref:hypothetical protein n=1 Tax=Micromonospora sp. NPDC048898 TaxID=3364260 RepID=UPI003713541D